MASYGHSCSQQAPQGHTSKTSYGRPSLPFASFLWAPKSAVCQLSNPSHRRATHQWLLMGVQVYRLPGLKPSKPLKHSKPSKPLKPSKPYKSADPGLSQGRGGAWDHRRCGTSPSSLSTAKPILQPSSHINSFCRLPALEPSKLHPAANSHPAPHINGFLWPFLWPLLQSTGTPGPHINGFLWASTSAVCQP